MSSTDDMKRYGCDPAEFLHEMEKTVTVQYAVSTASGFLRQAQYLVSDAQLEVVYGDQHKALRTMECVKLLIDASQDRMDQLEIERRCSECGASMMLICRCGGGA